MEGDSQPDHADIGVHGCLELIEIRHFDKAEVQCGTALADTIETVAACHRKDRPSRSLAAAVEQFEYGSSRGHARGERESMRARFEIGDAAFVGHTSRVLCARILVSLMHAGAGSARRSRSRKSAA